MPVPIKYKCPSCKGESDMEGVRCLPCTIKVLVTLCTMHDLIKSQHFKHVLREYRTKE
jgi:DNA-directed RNA polymerase subunit RPC12/RpoP